MGRIQIKKGFVLLFLLGVLWGGILFYFYNQVDRMNPGSGGLLEFPYSDRSRDFKVSSPKFLEFLKQFDWANFSLAINQKNLEDIEKLTSELILLLTPYLIKEPLTPVNSSCICPQLRTKEKIVCENGSIPNHKKLGLLLQLGFEVDTLEIHLNELFDVVDRFFLTESTHSHGRLFRKPLIWERVKDQARFQRFLPKIVHLVVDDAEVVSVKAKLGNGSLANFDLEDLQEKLGWEKFLKWNNATGFFTETDLLGFGDCDEIASRETVNYLRHCPLKSDPIDVGIWFPFGAIDQAYLTDFPVNKAHPFTLGDPTFWTLNSAMDPGTLAHFNFSGYPTRNRGKSAEHVLGEMHMSNYGYLPSLLIKRVTASEVNYGNLRQVAEFPKLARNMTLQQLEDHYREQNPKTVEHRIFTLKQVKALDSGMKTFVVLPWFYNCNRARYPAWERESDSRLH